MAPSKVKNDKPDDFATYSVMVCVLSFNKHRRGSLGNMLMQHAHAHAFDNILALFLFFVFGVY